MSGASPPAIPRPGERFLAAALGVRRPIADAKDARPGRHTMRRLVGGWKEAGGEVELELYRGAGPAS